MRKQQIVLKQQPDPARLRLLRQVDAVLGDEGIGLVQQRQVIGIAARDIAGEIWGEGHHAVAKGFGPTNERHALFGQAAKIDR